MSPSADQLIVADLPLAVAAELIDTGHATLASPVRGPAGADTLQAVITVVGTAGSLVTLAQAPATVTALAHSLSSWWSRRRSKTEVPVHLIVRSDQITLDMEGNFNPDVLAEFLRRSL
jgi:hypothetical protein